MLIYSKDGDVNLEDVYDCPVYRCLFFLQVLDLTICHCSTSSRQDSKGSSSYCFSLPLKTHQPKMASSLAAAGAAILTQTGDKKLFSSK